MLPHISFDIEREIIKRLPVKSLIQFRSVCKAWNSFIDSAEFIAGYRSQSQHLMIRYEVGHGEEKEEKYVCYVDDDDDDDSFPQQKFALTVPPVVQLTIKVIGSSHGLLCLIGYVREPNNPFSKKLIAVLWNHTIRKLVAVDVPNVVHRPFTSVVGFGVCPHTKDPKLVMITFINEVWRMGGISCIPYQVMVFTLSSREWTPSRSDLPRKSIKFTWSSTVIGQFIYWHAYDCFDVEGDDPRNLIMSFDMSSQEFGEIDLPDSLAYVLQSDLSLSRLRESLVLLAYNMNFTTNKQVCDVWMMEHADSKAFTRLFTINPPNASVSRTLGFRKSGEPIVEMQDDNEDCDTPHALVVYEPCSEHIRDLGIRGNRYSLFVSSYTESLLLLNHDDGRII